MDYYHVTKEELEIGTLLSTKFIPKTNRELVYMTAKIMPDKLDRIVLAARANKVNAMRSQTPDESYLIKLKCQAEGIIEYYRQKKYPEEMPRYDSIYLSDNIEDARAFAERNRKGCHIYKVELLDENPLKIKKYKMEQYELIKQKLDNLWSCESDADMKNFLNDVEPFIDDYFNGKGNGDFYEYLTVDNNAKIVEKIQ